MQNSVKNNRFWLTFGNLKYFYTNSARTQFQDDNMYGIKQEIKWM